MAFVGKVGFWLVRKIAPWFVIFATFWLAGERYGAPTQVVYFTDQAFEFAEKQSAKIKTQIVRESRQALHRRDEISDNDSNKSQTVEQKRPSSHSASIFDQQVSLQICEGLTVSNAPPHNSETNMVSGFKPFIRLDNGKLLAVNPAIGSCLSSGFGRRNGRPHKGLDFDGGVARPIYAAAKGKIVEVEYHGGYGNYILIDHGDNVFTRYAHLKNFSRNIKIGQEVELGEQIGIMGNTANRALAVHLHYELLMGNYDTPKKSFGLVALNIFSFPFVSSDHSYVEAPSFDGDN